MEESILTSIKKLVGGIDETDESFDQDLIIAINSVLSILAHVGVGPAIGFRINNKTAKWSDFLPTDTNLEDAKSYMHLKVKLLFDPPTSSYLITLMEKQAEEFLWYIEQSANQS